MKNGKIVKTLPNGHEEIIEVDVKIKKSRKQPSKDKKEEE